MNRHAPVANPSETCAHSLHFKTAAQRPKPPGSPMTFTKMLRPGIKSGEITTTVRFWHSPRVTQGKRYAMEEGEIEIDMIRPIGLPDITPTLARQSGFLGVLDLLKVAKHGSGQNIYLIHFHYIPPAEKPSPQITTQSQP